MFNLKKPEPKPTALDNVIETLTHELESEAAGSEEEARIADALKKACEAKAALLNADTPDFVRAEVWATIAASLAGTVLMLNYEHAHVITSKVLGHIIRIPSVIRI